MLHKYTLQDYITLIEEMVETQDRLTQIFKTEMSEEEQIEKEKYIALLNFLKHFEVNNRDKTISAS